MVATLPPTQTALTAQNNVSYSNICKFQVKKKK